MKTRATARYIRVPASKARLVLDHIRGKSAGEALAVLQFTPKAAARLIEKVLRSAIANAEHNHQVRDLDDLREAVDCLEAYQAFQPDHCDRRHINRQLQSQTWEGDERS